MRRAILFPVGLLLAFGAGSCVLALGLAIDLASSPALTSQAMVDVASLILGTLRLGSTGQVFGSAMMAVWRMLITVCFVPVCLVAVVGEAIGVRSVAWCVGGTALLTLALPSLRGAVETGTIDASGSGALAVVLLTTGTAAGAVHWLVAGSRREEIARRSISGLR